MGKPYSKINIGDIYESPMAWTGSKITYTVTDKADGMIEVMSSYQHPKLSPTIWKNPSDRLFNKLLFSGAVGNAT